MYWVENIVKESKSTNEHFGHTATLFSALSSEGVEKMTKLIDL